MSKSNKILVVEDDIIAIFVVSNILKELKLQFDIANTGKQALSLTDQHQYAFILMDIGLPDINGFEVTKKIRQPGKLNHPTPIIALTAHDDQKHRENALQATINDFIAKPLTLDNAKEILKKFSIHIK